MALILNARGLAKSFGSAPLFREVAFTISDGDRIGLIGPNGSGKSTLLRIMAGEVAPDTGELALRKYTKLSFVAQESDFSPDETVRGVATQALVAAGVPESEREPRLAETLGRAGFTNFEVNAGTLSGGWKKRLAIASALVQKPDILLLDEPTNHLDLAGIEWLELLLENGSFACVVVSHDRYFLENVANEMAELNSAYPEGMLRVHGNYSAFLEKKEEFLQAQAKRQESLENRVRIEIEWLRRGPKARGTKAKARINKAQQMIGELADLNTRTRTATAGIEFSATDRKTKRLVELEELTCEIGGRTLFANLDFVLTAGMRVGLVGPNGSGKTTLLRLLNRELNPSSGTVKHAASLRVVYFDQTRELDPDVSLRRTLAPDSDSVIYDDRVIHVASWAARFLFTGEQLNQPVGRLSGGERARVLIAKTMLQPADLLLLDEPTNDLDIPTLEVLEESLLDFGGAMVLVTHDRYMLDRISTTIVGLDGRGEAGAFADYSQWEEWQEQSNRQSKVTAETRGHAAASPRDTSGETRGHAAASPRDTSGPTRKKLSYLEAREYATIEQRIAEAEEALRHKRTAHEDPAIASDAARLVATETELHEAQRLVDQLYARWSELEEKQS